MGCNTSRMETDIIDANTTSYTMSPTKTDSSESFLEVERSVTGTNADGDGEATLLPALPVFDKLLQVDATAEVEFCSVPCLSASTTNNLSVSAEISVDHDGLLNQSQQNEPLKRSPSIQCKANSLENMRNLIDGDRVSNQLTTYQAYRPTAKQSSPTFLLKDSDAEKNKFSLLSDKSKIQSNGNNSLIQENNQCNGNTNTISFISDNQYEINSSAAAVTLPVDTDNLMIHADLQNLNISNIGETELFSEHENASTHTELVLEFEEQLSSASPF